MLKKKQFNVGMLYSIKINKSQYKVQSNLIVQHVQDHILCVRSIISIVPICNFVQNIISQIVQFPVELI